MKPEQLQTLLGSLSGHLISRVSREEREIESLNKLLSRSLLPEDLKDLKSSSFAFEGADLFSLDNVPAGRLETLRSLTESTVAEDAVPEFRAFVREVPVRSTQLHASMPLWAGGASVETTVGPFTRTDGRQFWFDFFRIEKLVALYVQNRPNPVLLFKVSTGLQFISRILPLITQPSTSYRLPAGSIWISSQILASNAPAGDYTGLTIKGGLVTLSAAPQTISGKLTVSPTTVITVRLELQQPGVTGADPSSPYGIDAREASLQLPEMLSFHFSAAGRTFDEISSARWDVFGHRASFDWNRAGTPVYDNLTHRVLIPFNCSATTFEVRSCNSPFHTVRGRAPIKKSAWALPAAPIDIVHPTAASGIGALLVGCGEGLTSAWKGLRDGELNLTQPFVMAEPGRVSISDPTANNSFGQQTLKLWKDDLNRFGTTVDLSYPQTTPFFYFTFADGNEALMILGNANVKIDRPVTVAGEALPIHSKNSLLILTANKTVRLVYLFDDNIFIDSIDQTTKPPTFPRPIALALRNGLFKVTPVNGCVLFGSLAEDFVDVTHGFLYLTFGMYAYIPTLPDPYAANLGILRGQFQQQRLTDTLSLPTIWMWLTCQVIWQPTNLPVDDPDDKVEVSFHFAPLQNQFQSPTTTAASTSSGTGAATASLVVHPLVSLFSLQTAVAAGATPVAGQPDTAASVELEGEVEEGDMDIDKSVPLPNYGEIWDQSTRFLQQDAFALLDVSTNADLLGVSFGTFLNRRMRMIQTHTVVPPPTQQSVSGFPLQVKGLDVVSQGVNVRAFTVPPISWEPVFNLTPPQVNGDPSAGFNYYPDDGGPARIVNFSGDQVALAPIPLTDFLVDSYAENDKFFALALFTLPFGLRALALLQKKFENDGAKQEGTNLVLAPKSFADKLKGARQLELDAGTSPVEGESNMFVGCTAQMNNVVEMNGSQLGNSTLGRSVTKIFNREFMPKTPGDITRPRGVPLTRIDLSGYGATTFSNWLSPNATIAATSQAKFDVLMGRCAHEIIQVKSIMYPWAIRVVRTITLLRTSTNYVYRHDSGWKAESHGKFDFSYYANMLKDGKLIPVPRPSPYEIHRGVVLGLYNATEIKETRDIKPFAGTGPMVLQPGSTYVDADDGRERALPDTKNLQNEYELQPVYFNADVEIENPVTGYVTKEVDGVEKKLIPSKRILGFVQLAPRGMPIPINVFKALIASQQGSIGGPIDTVVNIWNSGQQMRVNRFDMNNSFAENGSDPVLVAAARGNVILPKDGSWSLVKHEHGTGAVSPVPQDLSVPLIRIGKLRKPFPMVFLPTMDLETIKNMIKLDGELIPKPDPATQLLRIANPTEILRPPATDTINYGFLHSTDTQKALFLTPSFALNDKRLLSKTPPLFADAFRLVNSKAVFPNIKEVGTKKFGEAIALIKDMNGVDQFPLLNLQDGPDKVRGLMDINPLGEQGYKLNKVADFPLPDHWDLINVGDSFRIYIEYKASDAPAGAGKLDFNVNSAAGTVADKWKSRMANVSLVVDLGPIDRLMTIKGNWDAKKGSEASFGGGGAGEVPRPQIEFSKELDPIIHILEILQSLSGEDYAGAVGKGVKLAMSNKAGAWEYKFEASKEIPLLRFPPGLLYNDPNVPLKLEAGLKLGAYFNAALMIETDKKQLLPSAGGFLGFYGRLSVMCVSLSIATVYAVGQANLDFGADTKTGPFLRLKFGFGAQIVVGLPVILNVSVLYMVGVEIYLDSEKLRISAFLLFQGHADILSGLVSVTITIEAKGTIERIEAQKRTNLAAQVSFALEITVFWIIDITISESWEEHRQIAGLKV
ncbi:MAG: hypothetical protein ND895_19135 [Pyrinomonadaceae bacterium]|nr:hypothetical protein [Pyrinomonadaceae bacterium]